MQLPEAEGLNLLIVAIPDSGPEWADKLWIRQVSGVGGNLMGYQERELLSKPLTVICPESVSEIWNAAWRSWRLGGGATHTIRCRNRQGQIKPWEATFSAMAGAEVAVLLQDFEPHEAKAPRRSPEDIVEAEPVMPPNAVMTIGDDKRVIEWNAQAEALFGCSRLDALGQAFPDFLITPAMLQSRNQPSAAPQEYDQTPDAVVTIGEDRRVTEWNTRAEAMFGWSRHDAVGQRFPDFLMPQPPQQSPAHQLNAAQHKDKQSVIERLADPSSVSAQAAKIVQDVPAFLAKDVTSAGVEVDIAKRENDPKPQMAQAPAPVTSTPSKAAIADPSNAGIVAQIQQSMLPAAAIENREFEVCFYSAAGSQPGGSFLDYFSRRPGLLEMTMLDASAHSQDAALRMLEIRSVLRAHANSPAQALSVLDEFLSDTLQAQGFSIAMSFLEYNSHKQQLNYANAGHLPGLLCRRTKAMCQPLNAEGSVLGAPQKVVYEENSLHVNSGDSVVLYSNALLALKNPQGEAFGLERLSDLLNRFCKSSVSQILDDIVAELKRFAGKDELQGDVAALVFKRR